MGRRNLRQGGGAPAGPAAGRAGSVLLTLVAGQFLMTFDSSVMYVAIATVVEDVGTTVTGIQAAIMLYTLVMAVLMVTGGKSGSMIRRRLAFTIGCVVYGVGSALTAVAPNLPVLIIDWSVLEDVGAALILPAIVALVVALVVGNVVRHRRIVRDRRAAARGVGVRRAGDLPGGAAPGSPGAAVDVRQPPDDRRATDVPQPLPGAGGAVLHDPAVPVGLAGPDGTRDGRADPAAVHHAARPARDVRRDGRPARRAGDRRTGVAARSRDGQRGARRAQPGGRRAAEHRDEPRRGDRDRAGRIDPDHVADGSLPACCCGEPGDTRAGQGPGERPARRRMRSTAPPSIRRSPRPHST